MTVEEKLNAQKERLKIVKSWEKRFKKLRDIKKVSEAEFCRRHSFHQATINRCRKGAQLASDVTIQKIEAALKAEGV